MNEKEMCCAFGERLRTLRRKVQLTQAKLAESADISCVYVNKLERGLAMPSLHVLNRLARSLNTDVSSLLSSAAEPSAQGDGGKPSPYMVLYLSGAKRKLRQLVFETTETPLPPLPASSDETKK